MSVEALVINIFVLLGSALFSQAVLACPLCHSDISALVQQGLGRSFSDYKNVLAVLFPFAMVVPIVFWRENPKDAEVLLSKGSSDDS
jgi:hypothetical protein